MATKVCMPKLGLTMTEGTIVAWHKQPGDAVKKGELLFEVETDKLTNEVFSDADGQMLAVLADEGDTVACTETVAWIGEAGEAIADAAIAAARDAAPEPIKPALGSDTDEGYVRAFPAAKKLAREMNIDLRTAAPSAADGIIRLRDIERLGPPGEDAAVISAEKDAAASAGIQEQAAPPQGAEDTIQDLPSIRRVISRRMSESWSTSPHVWYEMPVDATNMQRMRERLYRFKEEGGSLTYTHIILFAAAKALMEFPEINASLSEDRLHLHKHANIGLAVSSGDKLLVPVIHKAENLGLLELAKRCEALVSAVREGVISSDAMTGGTFTVTNLGKFGVRASTPIINPPELAILGVYAIVKTPVVIDDAVAVRPMMNLCLGADHRAIDGVKAAQFLKRIVDLLNEPLLMLL